MHTSIINNNKYLIYNQLHQSDLNFDISCSFL